MKLILRFFLLLFCIGHTLSAQNKNQRELSGVVFNSNGTPYSNFSFYVNNARRGGVFKTNLEGYFRIKVEEGSKLQFCSTLVDIKDKDSLVVIIGSYQNVKVEWYARENISGIIWELPLKNVSDSIQGVGIFENDTPSWIGYQYNPFNVTKIFEDRKGISVNQYVPKTKRVGEGFLLNFSSITGLTFRTQLPKLQTTYAQGQSFEGKLKWFGPDNNEIFSWGPSVRTLEYDGSDYPYDVNGRLVPAGTGNGIPANSYGLQDFFRTGFYTQNNVNLCLPGFFSGYLETDFGQKLNNSPLRNSDLKTYNFLVALKRMKIGEFTGEIQLTSNKSEGKLLARGANIPTILYSLYTTPVTFDNTNTLSSRIALKSNKSWLLDDKNKRSFAPDRIDNPYSLLINSPDQEESSSIIASGKLYYRETSSYGFKSDLLFDYGNYTNDRSLGFSNSVLFSDFLSVRKAKNENARLQFNPSYYFNDKFKLFASYILDYNSNKIHMINQYELNSFADSIDNLRTINELRYGGEYNFRGTVSGKLSIQFNNYFGNTKGDNVSRTYTSPILPTFGFRLNANPYSLEDIFRINNISIYGNAGKSISEAPLVYDSYSALSTVFYSTLFREHRENIGIREAKEIDAEKRTEYAAGLSVNAINNRLNLDLNYFYSSIDNYIAPVNFSNAIKSQFYLKNMAQLANYGTTISISFSNNRHWNDFSYTVNLIWSNIRNKVKKVYSDSDAIPLAGFKDIATYIKEGEELGAIYGSKWQRNEEGKLLIGEDGFPISGEAQFLGNSVPDWTAALRPNFFWKNFSFGFTFEYSKGGKVWNGTQAMLDYFGRSESTAEQRNIKGYIFDGVNQNGTPNTKAVDFYNPLESVYQNRWVRNGISGVAEDYVQDASFLRLSELFVSYKFKIRASAISNLSLGFSCNNLMLITKYKGVDPTSTLYNERMGRGLDLFNMPGIRSFAFALKITLRD